MNSGDVDSGSSKQVLDTSRFVNLISHWFDLMNSQSSELALRKLNNHKYDKEIAFISVLHHSLSCMDQAAQVLQEKI